VDGDRNTKYGKILIIDEFKERIYRRTSYYSNFYSSLEFFQIKKIFKKLQWEI
jgi:hypothetical protein